MQTFKDREGIEWEIDLTFGEIERIKTASADKFDLYEPEKDDLAKRLDDKLVLVWELLWFIVEPQAMSVMPSVRELRRRGNREAIPGSPGITATEFGQRLAGSVLVAARDALFLEWRDFFLQIQRPDLAAALEALIQINQVTVARVTERVEASQLKNLRPLMTAKIDRALDKPFSELRERLDAILNDTPTGDLTNSTKDFDEPAGPTR